MSEETPPIIGPLGRVPALVIEQAGAYASELDQQASAIQARADQVRREALVAVLEELGAPGGVRYEPVRHEDGKLYLEPRGVP